MSESFTFSRPRGDLFVREQGWKALWLRFYVPISIILITSTKNQNGTPATINYPLPKFTNTMPGFYTKTLSSSHQMMLLKKSKGSMMRGSSSSSHHSSSSSRSSSVSPTIEHQRRRTEQSRRESMRQSQQSMVEDMPGDDFGWGHFVDIAPV